MSTVPCEAANFKDNNGNFYQAGSQAYYACQHFKSIENTNLFRNIIAGVQAATQIYFADKQYEVAKQAQDRLDADAAINRDRSATTFGQFTKGIACEDAMRDEVCAEVIPPPDINDVRRMAEASVKRAYAPIRKKIADCTPVHCIAAACDQLASLAMKEAKDIAALTQQMFRQEMARWDTRVAASRSFKYQLLGLGRGYVGSSTALMDGARLNTQAASQINPYSGAIQAVNSIATTARNISLQEANNFGGMVANIGMGMNTNRQSLPGMVSGSQITNVDTDLNNAQDQRTADILMEVQNGSFGRGLGSNGVTEGESSIPGSKYIDYEFGLN